MNEKNNTKSNEEKYRRIAMNIGIFLGIIIGVIVGYFTNEVGKLVLYPSIIFLITFLIQLFFIINKKNTEIKYWRIGVKIFVALIISIIIGILSFYIFGIYVLAGLNEGR